MVIYKITNLVNGKIYVGKTIHDLKVRIGQHKNDSKSTTRSYSSKLYNAIKKYGWDSFKWEIVEKCKNESELNEREIFWIKNLGTINGGYNINEGGNGGDNYKNHPNLEGIKKKISDGVKNSNRWTDEKRKINGDRIRGDNCPMKRPDVVEKFKGDNNHMRQEKHRKRLSENNPMKNEEIRKKHLDAVNTPEFKLNMSNKIKGKKHPPRSQEHRDKLSASNKGKKLSQEHKNKLSKSLKGRKNLWGDKIGKSLSGKEKSEQHKEATSKSRSKEWWVQFDKETCLILNIFDNGKQIERTLNINSSNIVDKDLFPTRNPYGYKWKRFKKNEINKEELYSIYGKSL